MTEKQEARITNLRYRDKPYPHSRVEIDPEENTITFTREKRGPTSRLLQRRVDPIQAKITKTTKIEAYPPKVTIDDASFEVVNKNSTQRIVDAAARPQRDEQKRVERLISDAGQTAKHLLEERAKTLQNISDLTREPRKTLMIADEQIINAADPVEEYREKASQVFRETYSETISKMDALRTHLNEDDAQRLYAVIYGIGRAQDATLAGDGELLRNALTLIERATEKNMRFEKLSNLTIKTITAELCTEFNNLKLGIMEAS